MKRTQNLFQTGQQPPSPSKKTPKTITFVNMYKKNKKKKQLFCDRTPTPKKELHFFSCYSRTISHNVSKSIGPFVGLSVVNLIVAGKYFQM